MDSRNIHALSPSTRASARRRVCSDTRSYAAALLGEARVAPPQHHDSARTAPLLVGHRSMPQPVGSPGASAAADRWSSHARPTPGCLRSRSHRRLARWTRYGRRHASSGARLMDDRSQSPVRRFSDCQPGWQTVLPIHRTAHRAARARCPVQCGSTRRRFASSPRRMCPHSGASHQQGVHTRARALNCR